MNYAQTVICPLPDCGWQAVVQHDDPETLITASPWRDGTIRDALYRLRELHIMDLHAEVTVHA